MSRYFIIAGEASGDQHAAALIAHIKQREPDAAFAGLGGDQMVAAGCRLYRHYRHMAFMGFAAVLSHLGEVLRNFRIAHEALLQEKPDVLILVDYPSFNLRIAAYCRKHLPHTRIIYYIPPKVWAWKAWRIHRIGRLCDEVWGIFPFEPAYYAQRGYNCTYVGNPTAKAVEEWIKEEGRRIKDEGRKSIALLPGSRAGEVEHCLPVMLEAARRMSGYQIVVAAAPALDEQYYAPYLREGEQLTRDTYQAVYEASAAVVNSGTATLETALLGCPQVAVYHLACSRLLGLIRKAQPLFFSIRHFTLVNILAEKEVIRELLANDFTADKIAHELERLLHDEAYTKNMLAQYEHIHSLLNQH